MLNIPCTYFSVLRRHFNAFNINMHSGCGTSTEALSKLRSELRAQNSSLCAPLHCHLHPFPDFLSIKCKMTHIVAIELMERQAQAQGHQGWREGLHKSTASLLWIWWCNFMLHQLLPHTQTYPNTHRHAHAKALSASLSLSQSLTRLQNDFQLERIKQGNCWRI